MPVMRKVLGFVFAAGLTIGAIGCKDASVELMKLADKACECKDADCGNKVLDEFVAFVKENKNARGDQQKANEAGQKLGKCLIEAGVKPGELMDKLNEAMK